MVQRARQTMLVLRKNNWISYNELQISGWDELDIKTQAPDVKLIVFKEEEIIAKELNKQTFIHKNILAGTLNAHPFFGRLRKHTTAQLVSDFNFTTLKQNTDLCQEYQHLNNLTVLLQGSLSSTTTSSHLHNCTIIYGQSLSETHIPVSIKSTHTYTTSTTATIGQTSMYRVKHLLQTDMREMIEERVRYCDFRRPEM